MILILGASETLEADMETMEKLKDPSLPAVEIIKWVNTALQQFEVNKIVSGQPEGLPEGFGIEVTSTIEEVREKVAAAYENHHFIPKLKEAYKNAITELALTKRTIKKYITRIEETTVKKADPLRMLLAEIRFNNLTRRFTQELDTLDHPPTVEGNQQRKSAALEICRSAITKIGDKMTTIDRLITKYAA